MSWNIFRKKESKLPIVKKCSDNLASVTEMIRQISFQKMPYEFRKNLLQIIFNDILNVFKYVKAREIQDHSAEVYLLCYLKATLINSNSDQFLKQEIESSFEKDKFNSAFVLGEGKRWRQTIKNIKLYLPNQYNLLGYLKTHNIDLYLKYANLLSEIATVLVEIDDSVTVLERNRLIGISEYLDKNTIDQKQPIRQNIKQPSTSNSLEKCLNELNELIGLKNIKEDIASIVSTIRINQIRKTKGLKAKDFSYNFMLIGPPGTGKTTVARIIAKILFHLGILRKDKFSEVDRSKIVADYMGQTSTKIEKLIDENIHGCIFIDEAYSLVLGNNDTYGKEAVSVLIKRMEDNRSNLSIILAGYPLEMSQFLKHNSGLKSRINRVLEFGNYSVKELLEIFNKLCDDSEYTLTSKALTKLRQVLESLHSQQDSSFGNARLVRNILEKTIENQNRRIIAIANPNVIELKELKVEDIPKVNSSEE